MINIARPFAIGDGGAFASDPDVKSAIKQNFINLIKTQKGERVHKKSYGTNIKRMLFSQLTEDLKKSIAEDIIGATSIWLPHITIKNIYVIFCGDQISSDMQGPAENQISVVINYQYSISSESFNDTLEMFLNLSD